MKKLFLIIVALILVIVLLGSIDTYRFSNGKNPIFALYKTSYTDGGTTFYYGPGYQLIDWYILGYDQEKEKSFYSTKREIKIFPFFLYGYSAEEIDKSDFEIVWE